MATKTLATFLEHLRRTMLYHEDEGITDGALLECFIGQRDEAAFAALLRRHGPMVLGICRRVLHNEADVEDCFQATFLVLVRRAASIRPRGLVGNWLYGVARNVALKAKALRNRRRSKEREAAEQKVRQPAEQGPQLQELLDQELQALPDKYRAAIVLCDLEGKTILAASRQLGCPRGTLNARLVRGRAKLARRLTRQGLTLGTGAVAAALAQNTASAGVPLPLVTSTVKAASLIAAGQAVSGAVRRQVATLTEGMLKAMLLTKLKVTITVLLALNLIGAGVGLVYCQTAGTGLPGKGEPERRTDCQSVPPTAQKTDPGKEVPEAPAKDKLTDTVEKLIADSTKKLTLMESKTLTNAKLGPEDVKAAQDYIKDHKDYTSYHLLFALPPDDYKKIPNATKADILVSALGHLIFLNDWGHLPAAHYDGKPAKALLETKKEAIAPLKGLLDDRSEAPFFGSKDATTSSSYGYRRCDFAY